MKVYILDDEKYCILNLELLLIEYLPEIEIIGKNTSPELAFEEINKLKPDLLFLDVSLQAETGFEFLERFEERFFEVVIVTAYDSFALQAYKNQVLDYIEKPINPEELQQAVKRVASIIENKEKLTGKAKIEQLAIFNKSTKTLVDLDNIIYLEADGSYTHIHLETGKPLMSSKNIKEYELILPKSQFFRIHHKYIVNKAKILQYKTGRGGEVVMKNNQEIEVSIRKKSSFLKFYKVN